MAKKDIKHDNHNHDYFCIGCGAKIQSSNPLKEGYIDINVLLKHEKENKDFYCKRCFDLKHYNKDLIIEKDYNEYLANLERIKKAKGFIVNIVDGIDLDGSIINGINTIFNSKDILLVVNKMDLFINSINQNKIYDYVRRHIKQIGVNVKDCILISSFKDDDIKRLINKIDELNEKKKDVYFVGMSNVGKSTIINKIIKLYTNEDDIITVSGNINTTLNNIVIPLNDDVNLIDTPGIINNKNVVYYLSKSSLDYVRPKSYIKPKTYQLNPNQSLFIAGFLRLDILKTTDKASIITNFSNNLVIHRTKLENADDFYLNHKDDCLIVPNEEERIKLGKIKTKIYKLNGEKKDICISGLGFLTVLLEGEIKIHYFENVGIVIRESMY